MSLQTTKHLVRQIGLGSGICVVVGSTIGSGIFKSPSGIADKIPNPTAMMLLWLIGGICALSGALTLAEIGSAFPYSGGLYVYLREAYGRTVAFLFGWAQLVLLRPASIGAVATVFGNYALRLSGRDPSSPGFDQASAALAIVAILLVATANYFGVKFGTTIQNLTTIAKTAGIVALIVLALVISLPSLPAHLAAGKPISEIPPGMFGLALVSVLWAYDGWADGSYIAGEVVDPRRNVPRAIVFGTLGVIVIYLLANIGYLSVNSISEIAKSKIIAADSMSKLVGLGGIAFIIATVMISTFGTLNGSVLTSPRIFFALAEDKLFFEPLARVHPRFNTPHIAVMMSAGLGILYVVIATALSGSKAFGALTDAFVTGILPFYALAIGSVFVFRRRTGVRLSAGDVADDSLVDPVEPGHIETHPHTFSPTVKTLLFPLPPVLFIVATCFLLINSLVDSGARVPTLITFGVLLAGLPIYFATVGRKSN